MDRLKSNAIMAIEPREGITAVEALAEFGEEAVSRLLAISTSLGNSYVKQAANSAIAKIKRQSI
jgi:HEAT repeat protein